MTQYEPNIVLNRLVVTRGGGRAFDQKFYSGVNIIRGNNSSGKSTIANLIFYVLGGENINFYEEVFLCDSVFAEVSLNGRPVSIRRDIRDKRNNPIYINWEPLESSIQDFELGWEKYPYARSESKESYSQVLFRVLGMPESPAHGNSNLTMHQLLRVMYVDQGTPGARIFRMEQFDSALTRETVGNMLCGVYNDELYNDEIELDRIQKEFDSVKGELNDIFNILGDAQQEASVDQIREEIESYRGEREKLYNKLKEIKSGLVEKEGSSTNKNDLNNLKETLWDLGSRISNKETKAENLRVQIADIRSFIESLEKRLASLKDGQEMYKDLGDFLFSYCPSCFSPLTEYVSEEACPLCKNPSGRKEAESGFLKMQNQLEMQLGESKKILEKKKENLELINDELPGLYDKYESVKFRYDDTLESPSSYLDSSIQEVSMEIGYVNQKIENLIERERLYGLIEEKMDYKAELNYMISELKDKINKAKKLRRKSMEETYNLLSEKTQELIGEDLERQDVFNFYSLVDFDFGGDSIYVNDKKYFSASSMVYLRNVFHLAFLAASCIDSRFRYPRFLLMDALEEGGMEVERTHNLQNLIISTSSDLETDHQIIFTTSELDPELENSKYPIGDPLTSENKALRI